MNDHAPRSYTRKVPRGPIYICDCGDPYIPLRGWTPKGCPRCVSMNWREIVMKPASERRRAQWREYKRRVRTRAA